jgi:hypothetical protein
MEKEKTEVRVDFVELTDHKVKMLLNQYLF